MKRNLLFLALILVMTFALAAMAASPTIKVRVVNTSMLDAEEIATTAGLVKTAGLSLAENPGIFPPVESIVFTVAKDQVKYLPDVTVPAGALKFSGSIGESEMLEFVSIPNPDTAGKFDGAVVSRDGTVTFIDDQIVIDYKTRSVSTPKSFTVKDGDVLLLFIKDSKPISFGHDKKEPDDYRGNDKPSNNNNRHK